MALSTTVQTTRKTRAQLNRIDRHTRKLLAKKIKGKHFDRCPLCQSDNSQCSCAKDYSDAYLLNKLQLSVYEASIGRLPSQRREAARRVR